MNVAIVSHSGELGGAECVLLELVRELRRRGVQCFVLLPDKDVLWERLAGSDVPCAVIPYRWWARRIPRWRQKVRDLLQLPEVIAVWRQLRRWKVDVVLTNTSVVPVGALAAFLLRKPHVWYIHEFGQEDHQLIFHLGRRLSGRFMEALSSRIIVNSQAVETYYAGYIPRETMRMIYCGVQVPEKDSLPLESERAPYPRLVMVGRIFEHKGQKVAIQALHHLAAQGVPARLALVGDGDPETVRHLEKLVADYDLGDRVSFEGYSDRPTAFMRRADIVLVCSNCEAFGRVTVEAMKVGKPVIGSRAGGTLELIQDGFTGLLFTPNDALDLAGKIRRLLEHPDTAREMGDRARAWATPRFKVEQHAAEVEEVLKEAIELARRPPVYSAPG